MKTTFCEKDGKYIATLEGRLDTASAEKTEKELSVLKDCIGHDIIIDCEKLEYISSSGLRILLAIKKNAIVAGSKVSLINLNNEIMKVFKVTGFDDIFNI